ncbi:hypothetical protein AYI70_g7837, partial [Smittium culicis]
MDSEAKTIDSKAESVEAKPIETSSTVNLTFLMISGERKTLEFQNTETIQQVKKAIFDAWPESNPPPPPPPP